MPKKLIVMLSLVCACFIGCGLKTVEERAEAGDAQAKFWLGEMYAYGDGVPQDDKKAAKWFRLAAEQGDADAQYQLGWMYNHGEGVPQDYVQSYA
jgi:TPR repeat protein